MISRGELLAKWAREGREKLGSALNRGEREFLIGVDSVHEEEELGLEFLTWHLIRRRKGAKGAIIISNYGDNRDIQRQRLGEALRKRIKGLIVADKTYQDQKVLGEDSAGAEDVIICGYARFLNMLDRCKGRISFRFVVFMGFDEVLTGVNSSKADSIVIYLSSLGERFRPQCLFLS